MALVYVYGLEDMAVYRDVADDVIILSPSLYWYKLCSIPTRNQIKAKKIAQHMMGQKPAHFSEMLLYKNDDKYDAYSYDKSMVKSLLKSLNLKNPKVYFANQLQLQEKVAIDDKTALYAFGDRVMEYELGEQKLSHNLKQMYGELLRGAKHIKIFEKSANNNNTFLLLSLGFFLLYVVLFSVDKLATLSKLDEQLASLQTNDRSFYEMKSLTKKYKKLESSSSKLQKELKNTLKKDGIKSFVYVDGQVKVSR